MNPADITAWLTDAWATLSQGLMVTGTTLLASRAGLFVRVLGAAFAYVVVAALVRRTLTPAARTRALVATSTALLAMLASPLVAVTAIAYLTAFYTVVEWWPRGPLRRFVLIAAVALQIVVPIWVVAPHAATPLLVRELVAFATNMTQLRCWSYAWDRSRGDAPTPTLRDYLLYMTFLPTFVGGPLLSFAEFEAGKLPWYWSEASPRLFDGARIERRAFGRIALGGLSAIAAMRFVPVLAPPAYLTATSGFWAAWGHAIAVYLAVYLGFSAWSESAIGCGRLAGVVLPENFDHAHRAYGIADFWRRWNIRLGWWMREYIYLPLGGSRRQLWRNTTAAFIATAVYHHIGGLKLIGPTPILWLNFYLGWLGWAALNTAGTLATRRLHRPATLGARDLAIIVASFLFSCVALQTAFFPAGLGAGRLLAVYRALLAVP